MMVRGLPVVTVIELAVVAIVAVPATTLAPVGRPACAQAAAGFDQGLRGSGRGFELFPVLEFPQ
jgi:hypothetical protein